MHVVHAPLHRIDYYHFCVQNATTFTQDTLTGCSTILPSGVLYTQFKHTYTDCYSHITFLVLVAPLNVSHCNRCHKWANWMLSMTAADVSGGKKKENNKTATCETSMSFRFACFSSFRIISWFVGLFDLMNQSLFVSSIFLSKCASFLNSCDLDPTSMKT